MKKVFLAALLLVSVQMYGQLKFTINGNVAGLKDTVDKIYYNYRLNGDWKQDSVIVTDKKYTISGVLEEPTIAYIRASYKRAVPQKINQKRDVLSIYLEGTTMTAAHTDSFSNVTVKGSKSNDAYVGLNNKMKPFNAEIEQLNNQYRALAANKDEAGLAKLEAIYEDIDKRQKEIYKSEFLANPNSPIALYILERFAGYDINADDVDPLFAKLPATAKESKRGKEMSGKLDIARITGIGRPAPDFTQNDTLGNPVSLASLRGKYLLIDFWASWCGPCRKENPNVVKAFNKYKEKGFHILGVSLDQPNAKDRWLKAIHDDQLSWTHVSDLQYWKNAVAVQYGVQAIPQNFLIDPAGKIIAKNLRGEELDKKLGELLK
ncbi:MAG TPA: TlpA disulfide reductase family protein [Chitinophagaceae bacterium]|nr:TlpA disulfide reductase family protein [Chitinophagaceae bacterium]